MKDINTLALVLFQDIFTVRCGNSDDMTTGIKNRYIENMPPDEKRVFISRRQ
jgi:hypothetical protein